ncbi:hypothetical protein BGX28_007086 [Mortierella sp. GBA30]|nr:hypothetical protein BGX28_007086 [Mortierella sp. GBA30]
MQKWYVGNRLAFVIWCDQYCVVDVFEFVAEEKAIYRVSQMIGKTSEGVLRRFSKDSYVVPVGVDHFDEVTLGDMHECVDAVDDPLPSPAIHRGLYILRRLDDLGGMLQEMALKLVCKSKAALLEKMQESMRYITLEDRNIFASPI